MSLAVGAGVLDSPAVILKVLTRLWANTHKKRAYSPIIVLDFALFRTGRPYEKGRIAAPLLLWQNADVGHWFAMTERVAGLRATARVAPTRRGANLRAAEGVGPYKASCGTAGAS